MRPVENTRKLVETETSGMYEKGRRKGMVRFALRPGAGARTVAVAGDFSDWEAIPMKRQRDGTFVRHVAVGLGTYAHDDRGMRLGLWVDYLLQRGRRAHGNALPPGSLLLALAWGLDVRKGSYRSDSRLGPKKAQDLSVSGVRRRNGGKPFG